MAQTLRRSQVAPWRRRQCPEHRFGAAPAVFLLVAPNARMGEPGTA